MLFAFWGLQWAHAAPIVRPHSARRGGVGGWAGRWRDVAASKPPADLGIFFVPSSLGPADKGGLQPAASAPR
ncbi:hypothetical protein SKAU_G00065780 [Synaphobranchus kaupii]|uniref:Uncharacterized protein n=1 Tax=Synaphobranchus kaupii TaxID=118154 RepID=A0A9Q1G5S0_SYNKA|nr:hypothetical protein SKAU_G00065780 [Synaphobranchus kaupii]